LRDDVDSLFRDLGGALRTELTLVYALRDAESAKRYAIESNQIERFNELIRTEEVEIGRLQSVVFDIGSARDSLIRVLGIEHHRFRDFIDGTSDESVAECRLLMAKIREAFSSLSEEREKTIEMMSRYQDELGKSIQEIQRIISLSID